MRRSEVSGLAADREHVHVQISDTLESVDNGNLSFLDVTLPSVSWFSVAHLEVRIAKGEQHPLDGATDSGPHSRVGFDPPWPAEQMRTVVFDYDVGALSASAFAAAGPTVSTSWIHRRFLTGCLRGDRSPKEI